MSSEHQYLGIVFLDGEGPRGLKGLCSEHCLLVASMRPKPLLQVTS